MGNPERDPVVKISMPFNGPGGPNCSMMPGELVSVIPANNDCRSIMPGELEPTQPQILGQAQEPAPEN